MCLSIFCQKIRLASWLDWQRLNTIQLIAWPKDSGEVLSVWSVSRTQSIGVLFRRQSLWRSLLCGLQIKRIWNSMDSMDSTNSTNVWNSRAECALPFFGKLLQFAKNSLNGIGNYLARRKIIKKFSERTRRSSSVWRATDVFEQQWSLIHKIFHGSSVRAYKSAGHVEDACKCLAAGLSGWPMNTCKCQFTNQKDLKLISLT